MVTKPKSAAQLADSQTNDMLNALRKGGLRLTMQRRAICSSLAGNREHPTAQALFDQLRRVYPSLSRATVYNTLHVLVDAGLLHELGTAGDGAVHFDADVSPHVNLMCVRCHRIEDFAEIPLNTVARRVEQTSGYSLLGARVAYYGLCPSCQKNKRRNAKGASK